MTERRWSAVWRERDSLVVGPSRLAWDGQGLTVHLRERGAPLPRAVEGTIRVRPQALTRTVVGLDAAGAHGWWPIAPRARVELELERPALRWSGAGYLDMNAGAAPLETGFRAWHWSRAPRAGGTTVLYDVLRRDGESAAHALHFDASGRGEVIDAPAPVALPRTFWRVDRRTRGDPGSSARVRATLEDSPFYARSLVAARLLGEPVLAVHESLSLERFRQPWVRVLLPFRMPRPPR